MKEYDNNEYGRDFHVIEYGKDDMFGGYPTDNMMNILMKWQSNIIIISVLLAHIFQMIKRY